MCDDKIFKDKIIESNDNTSKIFVSLKVDKYGNVYAAPLNRGERALSFEEVSAIAASRR